MVKCGVVVSKLLGTALTVLLPLKYIGIVMFILITVDFFTGIWKAKHLKEPVSSRKMSNTVAKLVLYQIAILCGFLLETYIVPEIPITKIVSSFIGLTELKSISENISEITGINFYKKILEFIKRNDVKP